MMVFANKYFLDAELRQGNCPNSFQKRWAMEDFSCLESNGYSFKARAENHKREEEGVRYTVDFELNQCM